MDGQAEHKKTEWQTDEWVFRQTTKRENDRQTGKKMGGLPGS